MTLITGAQAKSTNIQLQGEQDTVCAREKQRCALTFNFLCLADNISFGWFVCSETDVLDTSRMLEQN